MQGITVERRASLPHPSDMPSDTSFLQIGCVGCSIGLSLQFEGPNAAAVASEAYELADDQDVPAMFTSSVGGRANVLNQCPEDCAGAIKACLDFTGITVEGI